MNDQLAVYEGTSYLAPAARLDVVLQAYQAKKDFINKVLDDGKDYGVTPGTDKPALYKPGAEKLVNFFGMFVTFEDVETVQDWLGEHHGGEPFFYYRRRANFYRFINGERILVGTGEGSCNSWEKKYRYRQGERVCPVCGQSAIIKGKEEYGGGWLCFAKKGGCGAKFSDADESITGQQVGQVKNHDIADQVNTILKMADKRALVAGTLITTGASDYFTQDVDDFVEGTFTQSTVQDEAQAKQRAPQPAPPKKANGNVRPLSPDTLADFLTKKAKTHIGKSASDKQVQLVAILLDEIFSGDKDQRHTVQRFLFGVESLTDAADEMILAALDWLKPEQDSGGMYIPDPMAAKEANTAYSAALEAEGQNKLL